jgi:ribonuclease HII
MPWWRHPGYTPRRAAGLTGYERVLARAGLSPVAGIDEAGRGACAGPLVVAAVVLDPRKLSGLSGVADSKTLTAAAREEGYAEVMRTALSWHRVIIPAAEIDACGLHVCNIAGMRRALAGLSIRPGYVLTDGFAVRGLAVPALAMWKGDEVAACVAAASIVAKVTRDRIMTGLSEQYPAYGFARHKGYSTRSHMRALAQHGPCPEHRASFANVNGLVRDLPAEDEETAGDREPVVGQEPVMDQEGYEQEVAGPEMAGQAVTQVEDGQAVDGQLASGEMLGGELAYR